MEKRASRSRWTERERAGFEIERSRERELGLRSRYMEKRELRDEMSWVRDGEMERESRVRDREKESWVRDREMRER